MYLRTYIRKWPTRCNCVRIIYYSLAALHVSRDIFAHHQEHLNCITASGSTHVCRCRLVSWECWNCVPTLASHFRIEFKTVYHMSGCMWHSINICRLMHSVVCAAHPPMRQLHVSHDRCSWDDRCHLIPTRRIFHLGLRNLSRLFSRPVAFKTCLTAEIVDMHSKMFVAYLVCLAQLTHCGRVTQICVFTLQLCRTGDADLCF